MVAMRRVPIRTAHRVFEVDVDATAEPSRSVLARSRHHLASPTSTWRRRRRLFDPLTPWLPRWPTASGRAPAAERAAHLGAQPSWSKDPRAGV